MTDRSRIRTLEKALAERYPKHTQQEISQLARIYLATIAEKVSDGKFVAFIDKLPSGEVELDALYVEDRSVRR